MNLVKKSWKDNSVVKIHFFRKDITEIFNFWIPKFTYKYWYVVHELDINTFSLC